MAGGDYGNCRKAQHGGPHVGGRWILGLHLLHRRRKKCQKKNGLRRPQCIFYSRPRRARFSQCWCWWQQTNLDRPQLSNIMRSLAVLALAAGACVLTPAAAAPKKGPRNNAVRAFLVSVPPARRACELLPGTSAVVTDTGRAGPRTADAPQRV